jgi:hypothetical protein
MLLIFNILFIKYNKTKLIIGIIIKKYKGEIKLPRDESQFEQLGIIFKIHIP